MVVLPASVLGSVLQSGFADPGYAKLVWAQSPNFNQRPSAAEVDTIVLHHTAGSTLKSVVEWFANPSSQVSAHYTIGKDGSIVQHVSTFYRAWHAGVSKDHLGRSNVNDFSIGIEMVNLGDGSDPWTHDQVQVAYFLCAHLKKRFPSLRYITSHEFVAEPQGRKVDPLGFPWHRMKELGLEMRYGRKP